MNTENEKRLDDLFKKKLEDPVDEIRYEEGDWDALEQMLDKPKRKGIIWLLPILSGVAAMLLLFLGWWAFRPKTETRSTNKQSEAVIRPKSADTIMDKQATARPKTTDTIMDRQATAHPQAKNTIIEHKAVQQQITPIQKAPSNVIYAEENSNRKSVPGLSSGKSSKDTIIEKRIGSSELKNRADAELIAMNPVPVFNTGSISDQSVKQIYIPAPAYNSINAAPDSRNIKTKSKMGFRPQYALSVVAAPDLNGVGSFQQSKVGTNIGLTFAATVSKKLTISTGALYSVKPYLTNFDNYRTSSAYKWAVDPINVTADCRMLDIPLNVGYQVYHKQQDKISVGTGLSSYLMLHESYKFNYEYTGTAGPTGPANYTVPNPGKYFFGVVNLNATYERQLNSKVGISIQPYLKLPLSNVGYSQVKLQTTGVAVGLSWNLNSITKP